MKTTAILDLGFMQPSYFNEYFSRIRQTTETDYLVVISIGNFKRSAKFTPVEYASRFEAFKKAGADLIFRHPVTSTCLRNPYFNFSLTSFINKLRVIDYLVLPVADVTPKSLEFAEKFETDLRFSYSSVKCVQLQIPDGVLIDESYTQNRDKLMMKTVQEYLNLHGSKAELLEIFGGTDTLIDHLLEHMDILQQGVFFEETIDRIATEKQPAEKIRQFLLRCIINFRKLDHSICALYEYSSFACVVYSTDAASVLTDQITKAGFIQVIDSYRDPSGCVSTLNESKKALHRMDEYLDRLF